MVSTNCNEMISFYGLLVLNVYKTVVACLLSVFVPQYCPDTGTTCSISDNLNLYEMNDYNIFVLFFNFVCLGLYTKLYYIES